MPKVKPNILVIDDEDSIRRTYRSMLKSDYNVTLLSNCQDAFSLIQENNYAVVLLDLMMPECSGLDALPKIKQIDKNLEVIMVTAVHDIKSAVQAIRSGAYDYITKPFDIDSLLAIVSKAIERRALVRENIYLRQLVEEKGFYLDLIGKSQAMKKVFGLIDKIAANDSTVLITGESGTGKELVAHALHRKSNRAQKPFVVVNCAALPETLIESELFGHERGAFTGATERKEGKFELADSGTIFLDEIGCLRPSLQTRLLRVIQDNIVERVGGGKPLQVDVRVIAATNLDLAAAIKKNEFREDLYYRLNVMRVHLPLLRERKEDVPLLLDFFLRKFNQDLKKTVAGFSQAAIKLLSDYNWPGNVRELQNVVERAVALAEDEAMISVDDIPMEGSAQNLVQKDLKDATMDFERRYIRNVLHETNDNQTKAADILGINRTTLIAKLKQLGIKG